MPQMLELAEGNDRAERRKRPEPAADQAEPIFELQRQAGNAAVTQLIQAMREGDQSAGDGPAAPPPRVDSVAAQIRMAKGGGSPLPGGVRERLEQGLGADLSGVRVHADGQADRLNRSVRADAFTTGNDLFFSSGTYAPSSPKGFKLLAHETTHAVQQSRGPVAATQVGGGLALSHPSDAFERAADQTATRLAGGHDMAGAEHLRAGPQIQRSAVAGAGQGLCIQRHSSWEHMLIGDLKPEELSQLGAAYDLAGDPNKKVAAGGKMINGDDVAHVIQQEIRRLQYFQKNPPKGNASNVAEEKGKLVQKDQDHRARKARDAAPGIHSAAASLAERTADKDWDVNLVAIPSQNKSYLVTYGELNTMADFFGSVDEMSHMDSSFLDRLIRGVRQSTMRELIKVYSKLKGVKQKEAKKQLGVTSTKFRSQEKKKKIGSKGKDDAIAMGGVMNELKLMGAVGPIGKAKPQVGGEKATDYTSTLGRNACHFAPESWHSYADHHNKALGKAEDSYQAEQAGNAALAADLANEALLINGFGDHYLQDSYAAGHLINKTQIMAFYTKWLDQSHFSADFHQDKNWRKVQNMAYGQQGLTDAGQYNKAGVGQQRNVRGQQVTSAHNPQAVTNIGGNDKKVKAEALGLVVPPSVRTGTDGYKVLTTWQAATLDQTFKHGARTVKDVAKLVAGAPNNLSLVQARLALDALVADGVVRRDSWGVKDRATAKALKDSDKVVLREAYIPKSSVGFMNTMGSGNPQDFQDKALMVQYDEYLDYMNSSFLQKATNALHNKFCKEGLTVSSSGGPVFKIYGDDAMFRQGASKGLQESGRTAHMSRESIEHATEHGSAAVPATMSTAAIIDRVPAYVVDQSSGGAHISLADWHNQGSLQSFCNTVVFPDMLFELKEAKAGLLTNKLAPGALSKNLGKIDDRPDKNELF